MKNTQSLPLFVRLSCEGANPFWYKPPSTLIWLATATLTAALLCFLHWYIFHWRASCSCRLLHFNCNVFYSLDASWLATRLSPSATENALASRKGISKMEIQQSSCSARLKYSLVIEFVSYWAKNICHPQKSRIVTYGKKLKSSKIRSNTRRHCWLLPYNTRAMTALIFHPSIHPAVFHSDNKSRASQELRQFR